MTVSPGLLMLRLAPVLLIAVAAGLWFNEVQESGPWVFRNLVPLGIVVVLSALTLLRGGGRWTGSGWRLPLGCSPPGPVSCSASCRSTRSWQAALDSRSAGSSAGTSEASQSSYWFFGYRNEVC